MYLKKCTTMKFSHLRLCCYSEKHIEKQMTCLCKKYDSFEETLPKEGKRLLDNLVDRMAEVNDLYCKEVYRQGIILGIDMMIDALVCDEDDEKN